MRVGGSYVLNQQGYGADTDRRRWKDMELRMSEIGNLLGKHDSQRGVTTVEYAVMLVLVAIAVLAFGSGIAGSVTNVFSRLVSNLS